MPSQSGTDFPNRTLFWSLLRANAVMSFPPTLHCVKRPTNWVAVSHFKSKKLAWSYESTEVYCYRILFLLFPKNIGTFKQVCQIMSWKERNFIPILEIVYPFQSQLLNTSPTAVNPIFLVHKKSNPSPFLPLRALKEMFLRPSKNLQFLSIRRKTLAYASRFN